jgi:hypothetical protein
VSLSRFALVLNTAIAYKKRVFFGAIMSLMMMPLRAWSSEATLQAAFVYNFIKFIDWPATESTLPLRLCVIDANKEMREALDSLQGKVANKKVIELVYYSAGSPVSTKIESCQMVYHLSRSTALLPHPFPKGLVLVANEDAGNANVSIVLLRNTEGRVEFSINQTAVAYSGVTMSSQLLKLAINTQGGKS